MNSAVVEIKPQGGALVAGADRMAVAEILSHVTRVQEVMRAVMKPDVHYGIIPGTDKPTLLKPGAELLCMTFRIGATYAVEDLSTELVVRYRVTCTGVHQTSGTVMGTGMGEASSGEEKYKWVKAYPEEWEATPAHLRRKKYGWDKQKKQKYEVLQVRTDPANLANTILKMANKRAYLAMVLSVTAASDCFAQDLEDMEERLREHLAEHGGEEQQPEGGGKAAEAEKKPYPGDTFSKGMPAWQKAVNKGKTPAEVLATVEQFNPEYALSEAQRAQILALKPGGAAKADATDVAPKVTYAQVDAQMRAARTPDQLNEAAALIAAIADGAQKEELKATYQELVNAMNDPHAGEPQ
jgi:hypothetical protein